MGFEPTTPCLQSSTEGVRRSLSVSLRGCRAVRSVRSPRREADVAPVATLLAPSIKARRQSDPLRRSKGSASSLLVGPVELVEDPVAVLEGEVDAFRFDVEAPLSTVAAFPDEPVFQNDGGEVVLAGDR